VGGTRAVAVEAPLRRALGLSRAALSDHDRPMIWRAGVSLALAVALAFVVVAPPERCPSVTAAQLRSSAQAAVDWFVRNQNADGTWLYLYDAPDDSTPAEYDVVRHSGAVMGLYRAAGAGLSGALRSADRGTAWALDRLLRRDGWAAVDWQGRVETGATALLVAGLVLRRQDTGETRYDDVLRRLGRFLVAQTKRSGAVLASYDPRRAAPVAGEYSKYYTGESYWALTLLHRTFPAEGWGRASDRIGAYLATSRDDDEHHWPPIADHWAAYGLSETAEFPERGHPPLTEEEVRYARRQAQLFGGQVRWFSERFGPWGRLVRGADVPRGGGYGVVSEGLTALWLTTLKEPRLADLRGPIAERATCNAGLAISAQSDRADAAGFAQPRRVQGAWFRDGETRMDDQQHALAGLLRTIPIVEARGRSSWSDEDDDAPSAWLWAIALVLALNPARAAFAVPRAGRSPRDVVVVAALGGAIGAVAACVAAAVGDPLLDALDVSNPSFRIAAGIVAGLAGAGDLFRRPPSPEPALAGWRAALVPVAIPAVVRPALLVLALGAGAERGVLATAAAMVVGIALLTGLVAGASTDGPQGRALRWTGRLLAAGLVACAVVLAVDGVFDV
jgi:small neutral amino acid transporter SnatA (MarC family)